MTAHDIACDRCDSPLEKDDLRCAICSKAAPAIAVTDHPDAHIDVLRCDGCGAAMTYTVQAQAPECAFCGSVVHIERPADPLEQTRNFVPFTVDRAAAEKSFRSWLRNLGWFRPSDLVSDSRIESLRALLWVGWSFDAQAIASWTADSDMGARRADWAPHAGQHELDFDDVVVSASRGLDENEVAHLVDSYDLSSAREKPDNADVVVEQFDVQRSLARHRITTVIEQIARRRLTEGAIPGRRFRNLHVAILLRRLVTGRYAFPAHVMAYRYKGRLYRFVLSGQDETCVFGKAPYSTTKILSVVIGGLSALTLAAILLVALA